MQERYLRNSKKGSVPAAEVIDTTNPVGRATVSVIITTFNHAHFLADAISSVLAQTRQADEIVVVDDGSTDHPEAIVANFPVARIIRQDNRGLPAARNTGLRNCATSHIVFLDADDRLLPTALESGLACAAKQPDCAFIYGGYRRISEDGQPIGGDLYRPLFGNAHLAFLCGNPIGMHATVLYRRNCLVDVGGFDETLRRCEDYELYLRIAHSYRIWSHDAIVAEYRRHGQNMSANFVSMLHSALAILDLHEKLIAVGPAEQAALHDGRSGWRSHYASEMLEAAGAAWRERSAAGTAMMGLIRAARWSPSTFIRYLGKFLRVRARNMLPATVLLWIQRLRGRPASFPLGSVRFGDLRRLAPISRTFGFDRGTPVDRYYIERFLAEHRDDIRGHILEVGNNTYTLRFGGARVEQSDILHADATNRRATIIGDLTQTDVLPEAAFQCIVITQVLHFLYDMRAAVATLHRALRPGGVLLLTMPGITQVDSGSWESNLAWSVTPAAVRRLLEERFQSDTVAVEAHGNVFAATAFLYGLAVEELDRADLDVDDANFPVIVAARAVKTLDA